MGALRLFSRAVKRAFSKSLAWVFNRYEGGKWYGNGRRYLDQQVRDAKYELDQMSRTEMVRKSLYFEQNSPMVGRMADLFECYVVGASGVPLIPASSDPEWNDAARSWWDDWCQYCDISTLQNFGTIQSLIARTWFIQGEIFLLKTSGNDPVRPRPRIQLIEGHRVCSPGGQVSTDRNIIDGIEYDASGRPIAYWIMSDGPNGTQDFRRWDAKYVRHIFEPSRAGQLRGLPFLHASMVAIENLDILNILEVKFAKEAARTPKLFTTLGGEFDPETMDRQETVQTSTTESRVKQIRSVLGDDIEALLPGEKYEQFKSERPTAAAQWLYESMKSEACAGVGILKLLVFPESIQGTVARGAFAMMNAWFRARSAALEPHWKDIYQWVIGWAKQYDTRLSGAPSDWYKVNTRPPRSVVVDGGRETNGMIAGLKAGILTFEDVWAEQGYDWKTKMRQKADEIAFAHQLADERSEFGVTPKEITDGAAESAASEPSNPQDTLQQPLNGKRFSIKL